ncbi:histone PARylation factor 1 isoform X2 [Protobothrops mucrosquamatus]|uniref:histone PARylation factor 1 isoform X2 n=2 Tax=Protobothrops mucrosquamatus TaxID=103944 RepID=UPI000775FA45|nr:histone PARylation factor 1 isoform X2 [Protobothrops mucrosquamatus]
MSNFCAMASQGELGKCYNRKRQNIAMVTTGTRMAGGRKQRCHAEAQKQGESIKEVKNVQAGTADVSDCIRQEIESYYRLKMPEDFYHFWKFCEELEPDKPCDALKSSIGLQLVGPYDILSGKHNTNKSKEINFNLHWRFFYDPPEFQTIIVGDNKTQFHMGYFRDIPDQLPVWVGETETQKGYTIYQVGDNIFAAVKLFLSKKLKDLTNKKRSGLLRDTDEKLTKTAKQLGYSLEQKSLKMKQRDKKVVTKTFHGGGLVVPVDKNNVGYRELPETNANLKRICKTIADAPNDDQRLKAFAPIQEMLTFVQFANDECDYGMGYELGIDLFCYGSHYFHKIISQLLPLAYSLLKRNLFAEIIEAHLANRRKEKVDLFAA